MADRVYILKDRQPAAGRDRTPPPVVTIPLPSAPAPLPAVPSAKAAAPSLPTPAAVPQVTGGLAVPPSMQAAAVPVPPAVEHRPVAATGRPYPTTAEQSLSSAERQRLGILASQAWAAACKADPDLLRTYLDAGYSASKAADEWRHLQVRHATRQHPAGQVDGISSASRAHFADIESHLARLAGDDGRAFRAAMKSEDIDAYLHALELEADGEQARYAFGKLIEAMQRQRLHINYLKKVIAGKCAGSRKLNAKQIWQTIYTINNRMSAKAGKGKPENRNKSQRRRKA